MRKKERLGLAAALFLLLLLSFSCTVFAATSLGEHGRLSVKGTKLIDTNGKTFLIRGVSTHGISWYPEYVSKAAFKELRDKWGVNTVRLAVYTAEYNGYCVGGSANQKTLKKRIDVGVKAATELGMYVIIDWHTLSDGNPNTYKKQSITFFKEMAKKYKNNKNVIYEICNEPNGGTSWKQIKSYAQSVIKEIRKIDKHAVILVGTPNWSQDVDIAAKDPIKGYKNIMYTLHFYANTHRSSYRTKTERAVKAGLPLLVSEFGICDASGNGGVNEKEGNNWMKFLNKYSIGCVAWNLSNKNESAALLAADCTKKSGWKYTDLSQSGKWLVRTYKGKLAKSVTNTSGTDKQNTSASASGTGKQNTSSGTSGTGKQNTSSGTSGTGKQNTSSGASGTGKQKIATGVSKKCRASVQAVNSWKSNGRYFTQYKVTLKNCVNKTVKDWKVQITFKNAVRKSSQWNGEFTYKSKTITIAPVSWNKSIPAKSTATEIGFIVSATAKSNPIASVKVTP